MAAKGLGIYKVSCWCSICRDLMKDPVIIPCGHMYCMGCVNTHWNGEVVKQGYSCPQCRQNFTKRPVLEVNSMLALVMEGLRKCGPPAAPVSDCSAAQGEVCCDLCSTSKVKAVKSCLQCLVSYCKKHLQPHYDVAALKKHKLVEPIKNLEDSICSRHDEVMKMFCRTDQRCICYLCSVDEHKDHDIVTAAEERTQKQKKLDTFKEKIDQKIESKVKNVASLQHEMKNILHSANTAVDCSDHGLTELTSLIEKRISDLNKQIISKKEAEEKRVKELQEKLQQEITELKKKHTELDSLLHTEDPLQFLHKYALVSKVNMASESPYNCSTPPFHNMVTAVLSDLRSKLEEPCRFKVPTVVDGQKAHTKKDPAGVQANVPSQQKNRQAPTQSDVKQKPSASNPQPFQPVEFLLQHSNAFNFQTPGELQTLSHRFNFFNIS